MVKQRQVFRLETLIVPDNEVTRKLRLAKLHDADGAETREFVAMEPDGDYRLGEVLADMMGKVKSVIESEDSYDPNEEVAGRPTYDPNEEVAGRPVRRKVCFIGFSVADYGSVIGLDLG